MEEEAVCCFDGGFAGGEERGWGRCCACNEEGDCAEVGEAHCGGGGSGWGESVEVFECILGVFFARKGSWIIK